MTDREIRQSSHMPTTFDGEDDHHRRALVMRSQTRGKTSITASRFSSPPQASKAPASPTPTTASCQSPGKIRHRAPPPLPALTAGEIETAGRRLLRSACTRGETAATDSPGLCPGDVAGGGGGEGDRGEGEGRQPGHSGAARRRRTGVGWGLGSPESKDTDAVIYHVKYRKTASFVTDKYSHHL